MLYLRQERQRRGWSLTQLTVKTGIDSAALSKIERGVWPCGPEWRRRISEAFDMPEDALFQEVPSRGEERPGNA
ncbi:MAG: helix-turn-helix transcriptional regulator [Firmicutes bacterium]|nr:helix-turn-helix transcriptional regulator [Bacillota bacterium]HHY33923.1 helix-turn-helix transcriptional regulator [Bacillota bacterium]